MDFLDLGLLDWNTKCSVIRGTQNDPRSLGQRSSRPPQLGDVVVVMVPRLGAVSGPRGRRRSTEILQKVRRTDSLRYNN